MLTLSGRIALWEGFLPHWVDWMRKAAPDVSLRLEIGFEPDIMQGLIEGTVDIGVMYTPEARVDYSANADLFGSIICDYFSLSSNAGIHYDESLGSWKKYGINLPTYEVRAWQEY